MADAKISELTALAAVDLDIANDLIAVVDTSATQTKKIAVDDILGNLSTLTAIDTSITATAVDVFVYDTSKDSDGGAWRKRCQHTSWYNETLNTSTRGSRREFPAVAVIVAEAAKVTIYDGDDPALPMWMVFEGSTSDALDFNQTASLGGASISSVVSKDANLITGQNVGGNGQSVRVINFVADTVERFSDYPRGGHMGYNGNIAERNDGLNGYTIDANTYLVGLAVNDVAMTVLPDAPIDPATGLPVPTIAVATDGGVSVIKDDGTVVDITYSSYASGIVSFTEANGIWVNFAIGAGDLWGFYTIPTADTSTLSLITHTNNSVSATGDLLRTNADIPLGASNGGVSVAFAGSAGLNHVYGLGNRLTANSMVAYTTSTYNTGWMNGDIKGAFLSDTDDTDLVATDTISDRSINALTLTLADAATVQAVATGAELVSYTFAGAESVTLGSDISTTGALIWWEKVSGIWQLNVNDLSGGTDYVNGIAGTVSTGLTISGTTLSFAASKEMALARATATIPTAGQIAKIYEDEKFLFQDNAACTLYGASDAVTALAHDPDTNLLHVGTSAGRSTFNGLQRVANTETPVGTAISAVNGLVVED